MLRGSGVWALIPSSLVPGASGPPWGLRLLTSVRNPLPSRLSIILGAWFILTGPLTGSVPSSPPGSQAPPPTAPAPWLPTLIQSAVSKAEVRPHCVPSPSNLSVLLHSFLEIRFQTPGLQLRGTPDPWGPPHPPSPVLAPRHRPRAPAFSSLLLRLGSGLLIPGWVVFSSRAAQHIFFLTHCSAGHLSTAPRLLCVHP